MKTEHASEHTYETAKKTKTNTQEISDNQNGNNNNKEQWKKPK